MLYPLGFLTIAHWQGRFIDFVRYVREEINRAQLVLKGVVSCARDMLARARSGGRGAHDSPCMTDAG